ncbi:hypothetical protein A6M27_06625 [Acidithiobacillus thiooxidans]|uniref:Uncharacterized protein n=1 Tax=Acidithiobacillus thiooxidans TaxID=930 RepID=A0A1C2IRX7_ACITH|nr:hypothetical protein A6M23_07515 [Acidithiobacillus thiooxidans]OCX74020.1 hypothetical protein A6P07_06785 [Acidithiobacillus thiooxidans]OCX78722.1 hypothetical protein A6O24_03755 [Acidithiobacillus thiooxidans]OCX81930.1 hypothetical protein A6O26_11455 [Acidithiobacillus thiooxidans]OCX87058.1 hypothetical protein A6P08_04380 [Acidithiobacillus thiooxidans]
MAQAEMPFIAGFYSIRPSDYQSGGLFRVNLYRQNLIRFSLYFRQREYVSRYPLEIYFFLSTMNQICISLFQLVEIAFPTRLFLGIKWVFEKPCFEVYIK